MKDKKLCNKSVAVVITHEAFALNKILLANRLNDYKSDKKLIIFSILNKVRLKEILADRNIEINCEIEYLNIEKTNLILFLEKIKQKLSSLPYIKLYLLPAILSEILYSKKIINCFREAISRFKIKSIILSESSPDYFAPEIISASKGITTVFTLPYTSLEPDDYALIYKDSYLQIRDSLGRFIAKYFTKWKYHFQSVDILRARPEKILAQELLNISSKKPWETFGFLEDYILSSNTLIQNYLIEVCKVPEDKIILTGSAQLDIMYQIMSNSDKKEKMSVRLQSQFGNDKPFILCALPQTHWVTGRSQAEFDNHRDMLEAWLTPLTQQKKYNVLLSLHPSMNISDFMYLQEENAKIIDENIIELIPFCKLFVNCLSSVMQYAAACGIPVLNYDVYRYSDDLDKYKYRGFKGIVTVTLSEEYKKIVNKICTDTNLLYEMRIEQEKIADDWGTIDGKSAERIASTIKNI